jgi:magnesium-transporting ATPase (P-type)
MGDIAPTAHPAPSGPNPWLAPILSITAIILFILWAYLQMRHWKEPDADYVAIGANFAVTLLLWAVLVWAIIATYRFKSATSPADRPVIKPTIVAGFILATALGLGGASYLARTHQANGKSSSPKGDQEAVAICLRRLLHSR